VNARVHPALDHLIMKALAKAPGERYQSGQELVADLEKCRESAAKSTAKQSQPAHGVNVPGSLKTSSPAVEKPAPARNVAPARAVTAEAKIEQAPKQAWPTATPEQPASPKKAAAAAAGAGSVSARASANVVAPVSDSPSTSTPEKPTMQAYAAEDASSAAVIEPEYESPKIAVDPMMGESQASSGKQGPSFSDLDELPPLKEVYIAPPPPPEPAAEPAPQVHLAMRKAAPEEKPKVQPREVARKAVTEIKKTPPKLFGYSIAGAVALILLVVVGIAYHIHNENDDDDAGPVQPASQAVAQPAQPAPAAQAAPAQSAQSAAPTQPTEVVQAPPIETQPAVSIKPKYNKKKIVKQPVSAPVAIPGQLNVSSNPEGAQVYVDGRTDAAWMTPYNVTGLSPGAHTVSVSKAGYASETRTIEVASASKSFLVLQLAQLGATISVISEPAGAEVVLDGKNTGKVTPAQISVEKPGNHSIVVRKQGYLEETTTANLQAGQTFHYSPSLRALGSTDEIKTVSKWKKAFGGGDTAGMGILSVKTNPKGAQIAVNRRILDKLSPVEFYLNPGTYVVDITESGFKDIHRVVTVDKGGKVAIDETMERD
jgi:hypothetical protein